MILRGFYRDLKSTRLRTDLPDPRPRQGEVLLRVIKAGICDTDIQLARGYMNFRGILGHEFVARASDGTRMTAEINNSCNLCDVCSAGHANHCPERSVLGILNHDGAMADWVCVPASNLHIVPDAIDDTSAVFIEPLAAAFRVPEQVPLSRGVRLAVVGDGKLGLLCSWVARLEGAETHLIGKHLAKLALAGEGIKTHLFDTTKAIAHSFDIVIEASGSPSGLATALELVRPLGTVVLKTTVAAGHETSLAPIVIDEVRVIGSRCGPFARAISALAERAIDVTPLIEAEFSLDDAEQAFAAAGAKGARKVLLNVLS